MTNLCKEIYTKSEINNMITNRQHRLASFELVIVPKELALKYEVKLDDKFVIAKFEDTIQVAHNFSNTYIVNKIEEQRPDIACAMDSTTIDSVPLQLMVETIKIT